MSQCRGDLSVQNCENLQNYSFKQGKKILSEVCMIKKKQRLIVLFTSDVMYKKYINKAGLHVTRFVTKIYLY